ncbi:transposase [Vagococcus fluvialis]|nr:transposase [Vagococcus fluvialis]NKC60536.1 transposase [Vagococcus fluvialis]NKD51480.1 transposase [Vagococcus fluvialis]UDM74475.1 transposase [Vagococcus fluvialis]
MILEAYRFKNRNKGARLIKMTLEKYFNTVMNLKKIRRLMKKFNLVCPIRKAKS